MDYRCLYGHRVPADFSFAIENDTCPRCGAQLVSVDGYQLARTLAAGVPLDAVQAFATVRFLEQNFNLTPKDADEDAAPAEESVGEIEFDEADEANEEAAPEVTEPSSDANGAVLQAEPEETEEVPEDVSVPVPSGQAPQPPQGLVPPIVLSEIPAKDDESMDDVEKAFFQ